MGGELERAWELLDRGEAGEALRFAQQSLDRSGESAKALLAVAFAKLVLKDFGGAREAAQRAVDIEPAGALQHYAVGCAHVALGEFEPALAATMRAIEIDPQQAMFYDMLGEASFHLGRFEAACDAGRKASSLDPTSGSAQSLIGRALARLDRPEDAKRALEAALVLEPDGASHHEALGDLALERRDFDSALLHYAAALRLEPERDLARAGALDAFEGKHARLRPILRYLRFGASLNPFHRGHAVFSAAAVMSTAYKVAKAWPVHAPWIHGFGLLVAFLASTTSASIPLLNALLSVDPVGRAALNPLERVVARSVVACLALGCLLAIATLAFDPRFVWLAIGVAACALPITEIGAAAPGWRRGISVVLAFFCLTAAAAAIVYAMLGPDHGVHAISASGAGCVLAVLANVVGSILGWRRDHERVRSQEASILLAACARTKM